MKRRRNDYEFGYNLSGKCMSRLVVFLNVDPDGLYADPKNFMNPDPGQ